MDLEFFFLLENIAAIIIGLAILAVGFSLKERLSSDDARQRLMANWRRYSIGILLFALSLFVYFIAESARFVIPYYTSWNVEEIHEWGEVIHMLLLLIAMTLSVIVATDIGREKR